MRKNSPYIPYGGSFRHKCSACFLYLPLLDFHKNGKQGMGYRNRCIDCRKKDEFVYRQTHKVQIALAMRKVKLRWKFGITIQEYENMFREQLGCCLICRRNQAEFKVKLGIDHDHNTGKVRGLLCHDCNTGLGKFRDSPELLYRAAQYILVGGNVPFQYL